MGQGPPLTFTSNQKLKIMYSLKCSYYTKEFSSIDELIHDVIESGMDPNYLITFDGESIGHFISTHSHISFYEYQRVDNQSN